MPPERDLLQLLHDIRGRLDGNVSLEALASRAGWSPFHLHRAFRRVLGETPKQYTLRVRLERAAARLAAHDDAVLDVAIGAGFSSHEVFTRAFRRQFGQSPASYRAAALQGASAEVRARHVALTDAAGPCIGLFHTTVNSSYRRSVMPVLSIDRRELAAQPVLIVRLRVARHEIATAIGEGLGQAFPYALGTGIAIAGRPFSRYLATGPGLYTMEVGVPVAATVAGEGKVEAGVLPGGPVVVGVHGGPYEQLAETYAAMERWTEANGFRVGGAPWESYITDPADFPDPADWRTEVYWPLGD
ncbi:MAG TPA: AraC family transcriptional regulator [Vicinamibacterales bacterium]|nr:AraC family transcriptional regulator [Vicinamibacterales bacterium]